MSEAQGVKSAHTETSGTTMFTGPFYLKAVNCVGVSTAGDIVIKDGGASGEEVVRFNVPGNANNINTINIPAPGILFDKSCYVTFPTGYKVTIFYGSK
jgi:hypothetical protein